MKSNFYKVFMLCLLLWSNLYSSGEIIPQLSNDIYHSYIHPQLYELPAHIEAITYDSCYGYHLVNKQWNNVFKNRYNFSDFYYKYYLVHGKADIVKYGLTSFCHIEYYCQIVNTLQDQRPLDIITINKFLDTSIYYHPGFIHQGTIDDLENVFRVALENAKKDKRDVYLIADKFIQRLDDFILCKQNDFNKNFCIRGLPNCIVKEASRKVSKQFQMYIEKIYSIKNTLLKIKDDYSCNNINAICRKNINLFDINIGILKKMIDGHVLIESNYKNKKLKKLMYIVAYLTMTEDNFLLVKKLLSPYKKFYLYALKAMLFIKYKKCTSDKIKEELRSLYTINKNFFFKALVVLYCKDTQDFKRNYLSLFLNDTLWNEWKIFYREENNIIQKKKNDYVYWQNIRFVIYRFNRSKLNGLCRYLLRKKYPRLYNCIDTFFEKAPEIGFIGIVLMLLSGFGIVLISIINDGVPLIIERIPSIITRSIIGFVCSFYIVWYKIISQESNDKNNFEKTCYKKIKKGLINYC